MYFPNKFGFGTSKVCWTPFQITCTLPETNIAPEKWWLGGICSGAMLVSGRVIFNHISPIWLLMAEILHHLGCMKPYKWWDKLPINWWSICGNLSLGSIFLMQFSLESLRDRVKISELRTLLTYLTIYIYISSWWFQPIWKILVKMGIFPK